MIIIGRSGENIGQTQIQVWEKVGTPVLRKPTKRAVLEDGWRAICVIFAMLFILENVLVRTSPGILKMWLKFVGSKGYSCDENGSSSGSALGGSSDIDQSDFECACVYILA